MTTNVLLLLAATSAVLCAQCPGGVERWPVKTLADADAMQVRTTPVESRIAQLIALPIPQGLRKGDPTSENRRLSTVEKTVYAVEGWLTGYVFETDLDIHMVIADDQGNTFIAEMPFYDCLAQSKILKEQMREARRVFTSRYAVANRGVFRRLERAAKVRLEGVGFFDYIHGQHGIAPNGIELHPVTKFMFLDQCTPTDPRQTPLSLQDVDGTDMEPWPPEERLRPVTQLDHLQDTARLVHAGYKISSIFISKLQGGNTWIVTIAGTQMDKIQLVLDDARNAGNATDAANRVVPAIQQALGTDDSYLRLVRAAIEGFPIPEGSTVVLVGHSLGGIVAQKMMVLDDHPFQTRWRGSAITFGSPAKFAIAAGSSVTRYVLRDRHNDDAVVAWCHNTPAIRMVLGIQPGYVAFLGMRFVTVTGAPEDPFGVGLHSWYPNARELAELPPLGGRTRGPVRLDTRQQAWCDAGTNLLSTVRRKR